MEDNCQAAGSFSRYDFHLRVTGEWCLRSVVRGKGGSCAYYAPLLGWSNPFPETTGYLIPTLLAIYGRFDDARYREAAVSTGDWLLGLQNDVGAWYTGLHPARKPRSSVFNTGQILIGMTSLYHATGDERYLEAGARGASWLARGVDADGLWPQGDYRSAQTPSYYTHVAWPMLEVSRIAGDTVVTDAAIRFLELVRTRVQDNGVISGWGFKEGGLSSTHTIGYAIRGMQECAHLLGEYDRYGALIEPALEVIYRKTEQSAGRLPGAFDDDWKPGGNYVCLSGNAQLALCLLLLEARKPDRSFFGAARKLVDYVVSKQIIHSPLRGMNGGVAGSHPPWGKYMFGRYPNWAAKYLCDALMCLSDRLRADEIA